MEGSEAPGGGRDRTERPHAISERVAPTPAICADDWDVAPGQHRLAVISVTTMWWVPTLEALDTAALRRTITAYRDTVRDHAERINGLNVYPVPDGDTGTNMARTLEAVVDELELAAPGAGATCDAISHGSLMGARGNSGVILSQVMRGLAGTLRTALVDGAKASASQVAEALSAASAAAYQAVLKPVEGTILTVARLSAESASRAAGAGASLVDVLRAARDAGRTGARADARAAAGAEGRRRGRRRRRRLPAAVRRRTARRRRRGAARCGCRRRFGGRRGAGARRRHPGARAG